jgi:hypothetical protein
MKSTHTRRITAPLQRQPVLSLFLPLFGDDRTSVRGVVRGSTLVLVFRLSPFLLSFLLGLLSAPRSSVVRARTAASIALFKLRRASHAGDCKIELRCGKSSRGEAKPKSDEKKKANKNIATNNGQLHWLIELWRPKRNKLSQKETEKQRKGQSCASARE